MEVVDILVVPVVARGRGMDSDIVPLRRLRKKRSLVLESRKLLMQ